MGIASQSPPDARLGKRVEAPNLRLIDGSARRSLEAPVLEDGADLVANGQRFDNFQQRPLLGGGGGGGPGQALEEPDDVAVFFEKGAELPCVFVGAGVEGLAERENSFWIAVPRRDSLQQAA